MQALYIGRVPATRLMAPWVWLLSLCLGQHAALAQAAGGAPADNRVVVAEIARSPMFAPMYGALATGAVAKHGLTVALKTTLGPDATMAALLTGEADIGLAGADQAIHVAHMTGETKVRIIAALSAIDGTFLISRAKDPDAPFAWDRLKGKTVIAWRAGSTPNLFFERILRANRINPHGDFDLRTRTPIPARERMWRGGTGDFAVFFEPDVSRFEREAIGYPVASIGRQAGPSVYAVFLATTESIRHKPEALQRWVDAIGESLGWIAAADPADAARTIGGYFSGVAPQDLASAIRRYHAIGFWKRDPSVDREAIADFQAMMTESGAIPPDKTAAYEALVEPRFAGKARRGMPGR